MAIALVAGFSLFLFKVNWLVSLMQAVQGKVVFKLDRVIDRIKILFSDVLGQSNVRLKLIPGLAHTLIFFGFLAVQLGKGVRTELETGAGSLCL